MTYADPNKKDTVVLQKYLKLLVGKDLDALHHTITKGFRSIYDTESLQQYVTTFEMLTFQIPRVLLDSFLVPSFDFASLTTSEKVRIMAKMKVHWDVKSLHAEKLIIRHLCSLLHPNHNNMTNLTHQRNPFRCSLGSSQISAFKVLCDFHLIHDTSIQSEIKEYEKAEICAVPKYFDAQGRGYFYFAHLQPLGGCRMYRTMGSWNPDGGQRKIVNIKER
jgi:hypothetical protein